MINDCKIYTVEHGWLDSADVETGITVRVLDGMTPTTRVIEHKDKRSFNEFVNRIDSGAHNLFCTDENKHTFVDSSYGIHKIDFKDIPKVSPDKAYLADKLLPLLSWPEQTNKMNYSDQELEYIARSIAINEVLDIEPESFTGLDALRLVDMLEFWASENPGKGRFGRARVKYRTHNLPNTDMAYDLATVAVLAGYTASVSNNILGVSYESTPIPGSRPKNEKWYKQWYAGDMYSFYADNLPILGCSLGRVFYLPFSI